MKLKNHPSEGPCTDFECLIGPFVDGELPVGEVSRLEEHLDDCEACRTLAEQLRSFDDLARSSLAEPPAVSAQEWGSMWESIRSEGAATRHSSPPSNRRRHVRVVAAAALFLLGVFVVYQATQFEPEHSGRSAILLDEDGNLLEGHVDDGGPEVPVIDFTKD